jgi:hypothetical protein
MSHHENKARTIRTWGHAFPQMQCRLWRTALRMWIRFGTRGAVRGCELSAVREEGWLPRNPRTVRKSEGSIHPAR